MKLPPPVEVSLDESVAALWRRRLEQHTGDYYAGVPISKLPEDLRVYEHLLWEAAPRVVIELGAMFGGSALWFRDRLASLAAYDRISSPLVISVDTQVERAQETIAREHPDGFEGIAFVTGDVLDPELPGRIAELLGDEERCLVVEDTAHTYETTYASLAGFSRFVPEGGFFVVEDGVVDEEQLRIREDWPRGVRAALADWLASDQGRGFRPLPELETYGLTCHPGGYLQRGAQ
jgi:cephalosporin hydroxylase